MASSLPSPADCCSPCDGEASVQVPGPTGAAGTNGTNGTSGVNAFSTLDGGFTMPAELSDVTVAVSDSTWMGKVEVAAVIGQVVFVELAGYMEVQSRPTTTSVILKNLQDVSAASATSGLLIVGKTYTISTYVAGDAFIAVGATADVTGEVFMATGTTPADWTNGSTLSGVDQGAYPDNSAPGTPITTGFQVSPGGIQGNTGDSAGNAPNSAPYVTMSASPDLIAEVPVDTAPAPSAGTYGKVLENQSGTLNQRTVGVADENSVTVDDAAGLTVGEAIFGAADGIESKTASAARTALGLVIGVADNQVATVDAAAGLVSGDVTFATANGLETKTAAAAGIIFGVSNRSITEVGTTPYNVLIADQVIKLNAGATLANLPDATGNSGLEYTFIKTVAGGGFNITPLAPQTLNGSPTQAFSTQYATLSVISDGLEWFITSRHLT